MDLDDPVMPCFLSGVGSTQAPPAASPSEPPPHIVPHADGSSVEVASLQSSESHLSVPISEELEELEELEEEIYKVGDRIFVKHGYKRTCEATVLDVDEGGDVYHIQWARGGKQFVPADKINREETRRLAEPRRTAQRALNLKDDTEESSTAEPTASSTSASSSEESSEKILASDASLSFEEGETVFVKQGKFRAVVTEKRGLVYTLQGPEGSGEWLKRGDQLEKVAQKKKKKKKPEAVKEKPAPTPPQRTPAKTTTTAEPQTAPPRAMKTPTHLSPATSITVQHDPDTPSSNRSTPPSDSDYGSDVSIHEQDTVTVKDGNNRAFEAVLFKASGKNLVVSDSLTGATKIVTRSSIVRGSVWRKGRRVVRPTAQPEESQESLPEYDIGDIVLTTKQKKTYRVVIVHKAQACYQVMYWTEGKVDTLPEHDIVDTAETCDSSDFETSTSDNEDGFRVGDLVLCKEGGVLRVCKVSEVENNHYVVIPVMDKSNPFRLSKKKVSRGYRHQLGEVGKKKPLKPSRMVRKSGDISCSDESSRYEVGNYVLIHHNGGEHLAMIRTNDHLESYQVSIIVPGQATSTQGSQRSWVIIDKKAILRMASSDEVKSRKRKRDASPSPDEKLSAPPKKVAKTNKRNSKTPAGTPGPRSNDDRAPDTAPAASHTKRKAPPAAYPPKLLPKKSNIVQPQFAQPDTKKQRGRCYMVNYTDPETGDEDSIVVRYSTLKGDVVSAKVAEMQPGSCNCPGNCFGGPNRRVVETDRYVDIPASLFTPSKEVFLFHERRLSDLYVILPQSSSGSTVEAGGRYHFAKPSSRGLTERRVVRILSQSPDGMQLKVRYCSTEESPHEGCSSLVPRERSITETEEEDTIKSWQLLNDRIDAVPLKTAERMHYHRGEKRLDDGNIVEGDRDIHFQGCPRVRNGRHTWRQCVLGKTTYFVGAGVQFTFSNKEHFGEITDFYRDETTGMQKMEVCVLQRNDAPREHTVSHTNVKWSINVRNLRALVNIISHADNEMVLDRSLETFRLYNPEDPSSLALFSNTIVATNKMQLDC